ncbi:MAG: hypothetical protein BGO29_03705 [Bacteroidales bacterium 36-12]|nr:MAG: hypothetical protein BGO29_03705 [Bacteroidales bacterium 36-12]
MSKFGLYNIVLKDITDSSVRVFEFDLNDEYFAKIDSPEVKKGQIKAEVFVQKRITTYELNIKLDGFIIIPCNRCLDEMEQPIRYDDKIEVKFGKNFSEENEIVIVPEADGSINIAWFLYEFIVLNIPIKHVHLPGECNKGMVDKLKRHITRQKDDEEDNDLFDIETDDDDSIDTDEPIDPRWGSLQNINFDNN